VNTSHSAAVSSAKGSPAPSVKSEQPRIIRKERKLSTITTEKRPERSTKSDNPPGLEPAYRSGSSDKDDAVRLKGATMSYDALSFDSIAGTPQYAKRRIQWSDYFLLDRESDLGGTSAGTGTGGIRQDGAACDGRVQITYGFFHPNFIGQVH
jgi:hypothetical protein